MGRTPCCEKVGLNRGPWTPEEDLHLSNYVETHGEGGWRTLPKKAGLLRCGKSCRLRWMNYLRPDVKRGKILPEEEDLILRLHRLLGNRWSLIAGRMPGRTDNEIKNYWNTHLSKKLITQGIDPRTHKPLSVMDNLSGTSDESDISPNSPVGSPVNENISVPATVTEKEGESPPHAVNDINTEASYVPLSPALDFSIDNQFPLLPTLVNSGDLGTPFQQNVENIGSNQINLAAPFLTGNSGAAHHQSTENFNLEIRRQWSSSQASVSEDSSFHGCSIVPTAYNKLSNTNCSNTAFSFPYLTTTTTCIGSGFGDGSSSMFSSLLESFANEEWAHVTCAQNPANLSYDLSSLLSPNSQFHPSK